MYAEITLNSPKILTYKIPANLEKEIKIGQLVKIPLAKKTTQGIIFEVKETTPLFKIKEILEIINKNPLLTESQIKLANWLSSYYFCSIYQALRNIKIEGVEKYPDKNRKNITVKNKIKKINTDKKFILLGDKNKEENYLKISEKFIKKGSQALILFADNFALEKFLKKAKSNLKNIKTSIITSYLKRAERIDEWYKIKNNESKLILGTRTAIFSPFYNLGLIIVDNNFDESFIQEQTPKYNTNDISEFLQKELNCTLILQSDIPTLDNFYRIKNGYKLIKNSHEPEKIKITINTAREILDIETEKDIQEVLSQKKQVILFLNRKGKEIYLLCNDCEFSPKCPKCEITMSTSQNVMYCRNCGLKKEIPLECPECGSTLIKKIGIGTEKLEEKIKTAFPKYKILRIDESTKKLTKYKEANEADIIIGTQSVKNLAFKKTKLLIVFSIDFMLNLPTYRAYQNTQEVISGLSTKMPKDSKIILKTKDSENDLMKAFKKQNYKDFFQKELDNREKFHYPPYYDLIQITLSEKTEKEISESIEKIRNVYTKYEIIGPFPPYAPSRKTAKEQILIIKAKKNSLFYDKILKSIKFISIERNPSFTG